MKDVTAPEALEIRISKDGARVWINTESGCQFRACRIKLLTLQDERLSEKPEPLGRKEK